MYGPFRGARMVLPRFRRPATPQAHRGLWQRPADHGGRRSVRFDARSRAWHVDRKRSVLVARKAANRSGRLVRGDRRNLRVSVRRRADRGRADRARHHGDRRAAERGRVTYRCEGGRRRIARPRRRFRLSNERERHGQRQPARQSLRGSLTKCRHRDRIRSFGAAAGRQQSSSGRSAQRPEFSCDPDDGRPRASVTAAGG
jgi:hypothetical protein